MLISDKTKPRRTTIMMKQEFEKIAGYEVTDADYNNIIEPMYMATNLSKEDFVKTINKKAFAGKVEHKKNIKKMLVRNRIGESKTPNNCYYYIQYVELVNVDIETGKFVIRELGDDDYRRLAAEGNDLNLAYDYDMDYIRCMDTKKKPISLFWFE